MGYRNDQYYKQLKQWREQVMPRITVNPNADADAGFDVAAPGVYALRIEGSKSMAAVSEFDSKTTAGNKGLKVRLVFADPSSVTTIQGTPARNVGSIIDNSILIAPAEKQGKLRSLVEACGLVWGDFDTEQLVGQEVQAKVDVEVYQGEQKNVVRRYIKRGA